jgi:hypothetical protein
MNSGWCTISLLLYYMCYCHFTSLWMIAQNIDICWSCKVHLHDCRKSMLFFYDVDFRKIYCLTKHTAICLFPKQHTPYSFKMVIQCLPKNEEISFQHNFQFISAIHITENHHFISAIPHLETNRIGSFIIWMHNHIYSNNHNLDTVIKSQWDAKNYRYNLAEMFCPLTGQWQ